MYSILSSYCGALSHSGQAAERFDPAKHDLVLTDFQMPGMELAEAIKARSPATPVILITAYLEAIRGTGGTVSNVDVLLGKPCSIPELHGALAKLFPITGASFGTLPTGPSTQPAAAAWPDPVASIPGCGMLFE